MIVGTCARRRVLFGSDVPQCTTKYLRAHPNNDSVKTPKDSRPLCRALRTHLAPKQWAYDNSQYNLGTDRNGPMTVCYTGKKLQKKFKKKMSKKLLLTGNLRYSLTQLIYIILHIV